MGRIKSLDVPNRSSLMEMGGAEVLQNVSDSDGFLEQIEQQLIWEGEELRLSDKPALVDVEATAVDSDVDVHGRQMPQLDERGAVTDFELDTEATALESLGHKEQSFVDREIRVSKWTNRVEPIRLQISWVADRTKRSKNRKFRAKRVKGQWIHVHQAIGGLICEDCGSTFSKYWQGNRCSRCYGFWKYRRKPPVLSNFIKYETKKAANLLFSHHSSWGSLDLLKADASSHSHVLSEPLTNVNHHLLCTPLPLEQAVCLSTSWIASTWALTLHGIQQSKGAGSCLYDSELGALNINNVHLRNLVMFLRHAILIADFGTASDLLASVISQRKYIPDVIFKASMEILRQVDSRDELSRCRKMLRELIETSAQPRTMQMHLEMVRYLIICNQYEEAQRELVDRLAVGKPYSANVDYLHMLGLVSLVILRRNASHDSQLDQSSQWSFSSPRPSWVFRSFVDSQNREDARDVVNSISFCGTRRGHRVTTQEWHQEDDTAERSSELGSDREGKGLEESSGDCDDGMEDIAACCQQGQNVEQARWWREEEGFEDTRRRLERALDMERMEATSQLLTHLLTRAGFFEDAACNVAVTEQESWGRQLQELEKHVTAQPDGVNGWRRLAEFRLTLGLFDQSRFEAAASSSYEDEHVASFSGEAPVGGRDLSGMGVEEVVLHWLRLDPVSRRGLQAMQHLVRLGRADASQLLAALAAALDYGPDASLQALLVDTAREVCKSGSVEGGEAAERVWEERREWWPAVLGHHWCTRLWSPATPSPHSASQSAGPVSQARSGGDGGEDVEALPRPKGDRVKRRSGARGLARKRVRRAVEGMGREMRGDAWA